MIAKIAFPNRQLKENRQLRPFCIKDTKINGEIQSERTFQKTV